MPFCPAARPLPESQPASAENKLERISAWLAVCPAGAIRSTFITGFSGASEAAREEPFAWPTLNCRRRNVMLFANLKIGSRLALGFGALLVLLLGVTLIGMISMESLNDQVNVIGRTNFPKLTLAHELSEAEYRTARDMRTLVIVTDEAIMRKVKADIDRARADFDAAWSELKKYHTTEQGMALLARIQEAREAVRPANDQVIELGLANKAAEAERILLERAFPGNKKVQDLLSEFMDLQDRATRDSVAQSHQAFAAARFWMALLAGIALLAGTSIAFLIARSILRPLGGEPAAVQDVMKRLADGDLSAKVKVDARDTTSIAYSVNVMIGTLARHAELILRGA
jgi:methyl-accepting chemotaxis protein